MVNPFAPLDQYQPFVDEDGRVTLEWYSWLSRLTEGLAAAGGASAGGTADYSFNDTVTAPPGGGQVRFDNATQNLATKIWISNVTAPGVDINHFLGVIVAGATIIMQDKDNSARWIKFTVSGAPIDNTTYYELPVTFVTMGTALPAGQRVLFFFDNP